MTKRRAVWPGEDEVLFPPNTQFKILKIVKAPMEGYSTEVYLEELPKTFDK